MPQYLAEVTLARRSAIPRDAVVNTFAFARATALDSAGIAAIVTMLDEFYSSPPGSSGSVADHLGDVMTSSLPPGIKIFDISGHLGGTAHGAPVHTGALITAITGGPDSLPPEVAACVSFQSDFGTDVEFAVGGGRPRARDRGRIFLGALRKGAVVQDATTKEPFLGAVPQGVFAAAAARLMGDVTNTWSVWSRKKATLAPVTHVWVDNAFDVQRRRGNEATNRYMLP